MPNPDRGRFLTVAAVLFAALAISNLLKPLQIGGERTGFVFLGERLSGTPNTIAGPIFGAFLAVYAAGIWGMRRWALPMGAVYAAYVVVTWSSSRSAPRRRRTGGSATRSSASST